jgi:hypothetical protein
MPDDPTRPGPSPTSGAADLARELGELARSAPDSLSARLAELPDAELAEVALRLPAPERLELLLHAPKPMALVRSLPDAELYLTVREIGPTDALPLLALASTDQVRHLLDLEIWRKDRFDAKRAGAWVAMLLEAGEPTLRQFLRDADDEMLSLLFHQWLRVEQIEEEDTPSIHGPGETETGDERGFVTPDGYHRVSPVIAEHGPAARRLLQVFFQHEPERFQRVVWASMWELPSALEEHALHWRQSRMAEHGFPDWEEALSAYAPPDGLTRHPEAPRPPRGDGPAAPRAPLRVIDDRGPLLPALDALQGEDRERVLHEVVSLANRLLVADVRDTGDPEAHRGVLEKAAGYLRMALWRRGATTEEVAGRVLTEVPALELFREGYAPVAGLAGRAERLVTHGWPSSHARAREMLDTPIGERLAGLLEPRPLYVDVVELPDPSALRDFRETSEVDETRIALEMAEVLGVLFVDRLGLDLPRLIEAADDALHFPRFSTLLLTLLAWHASRGELRCEPLTAEVTSDFLRSVASRRTAGPEAAPRALEALMRALADKATLSGREAAVLQAFGRACLERLSEECGGLDPGTPVDPRNVSCLLLPGST